MRLIFILLWSVLFLFGVPRAEELTFVYSVDIGGHVATLSKIEAFARGVRKGGRPTLLFDGGNALSSVEGAYKHPRHSSLSVHLMNQAGYNGWFVGYADASREGFSSYAATANFPAVASNLHRPETGRPPLQVQPIAVVRAGRARIGLLGVTPQAEGFATGSPIQAAQYHVRLLAPRCDLIVALSNLPRDEADRLGEIEDLDVVLNRSPGETVWVQSGSAYVAHVGAQLAGIDLTYEGRSVTGGSINEIDIEGLGPAPTRLPGWSMMVEGQPVSLTEEIGRSSGGFIHAAVGYLIADVMRQAAGTDLGLVSVGHVGVGPPSGGITPDRLIDMYPFDANVGVATLKGAALRELLSLSDIGELMFYPSGGVLVYERQQSGGTTLDILIGGSPIVDKKDYTVAVETNVTMPARVRVTETSVLDAIATKVRTSPTIRGVVDARIQKR